MAKVIEETPERHAAHARTNIHENVIPGEPGYGLGLAGFIVSFFVSLAGLIMSAIALKQSKAIGKKNGFALAGLIIGIVFTAIWILSIVASIIGIVTLIGVCTSRPDSEFCRESPRDDSRYYQNYDDQAPTDRTY